LKLLPSLGFLLIALAAIALTVLRKRGLSGPDNGTWPFYAKPLLSQPEQVLYDRLVTSLPEQIILAQVQVSRVLGVKKGFNVREWNNRINRMSYDFVVCAKDSSVVAAIELDDPSHESSTRAEADERKAKATSAAGIRLIRWHVTSLPTRAAIKAALAQPRGPLATSASSGASAPA
jgi:hypothetical protein